MTPAVRRAHQWLVIALLVGAGIVAISTRREPSWVGTRELFVLIHQGAIFVDIRSARVFAMRSIPGAVNIPERELLGRLDELPRDVPIVVFGGIGNDSASAYALLHARGLPVYDLGPMSRLPRGYQGHMLHGERLAGAGHRHGSDTPVH